jgi:hypothetical protein
VTKHSLRFPCVSGTSAASSRGTDYETPVTVAHASVIAVSISGAVGQATNAAVPASVNGALRARIAPTVTVPRAETIRNDVSAPQRMKSLKGSRHDASASTTADHVGRSDVVARENRRQGGRVDRAPACSTPGASGFAGHQELGDGAAGSRREALRPQPYLRRATDRPNRVSGGIASLPVEAASGEVAILFVRGA